MGWLAQGGGLRWVVSASMIGLGLATLTFGLLPASLPLFTLVGGISGFLLFGGASGLYATLATTFRDEARATGAGFVIGVGRVSSAVAPTLAGLLFAGGLERAQVSAAFGAFAALGGLILLLGWTRFRKQ
jgi:AAHS family 4-hydroxybenzoate transporter-like MFS transporter